MTREQLANDIFNTPYAGCNYNEKEHIEMVLVKGKKCINCDNDATHAKDIMTEDGMKSDAPVCDLCGNYYDDFRRLP